MGRRREKKICGLSTDNSTSSAGIVAAQLVDLRRRDTLRVNFPTKDQH